MVVPQLHCTNSGPWSIARSPTRRAEHPQPNIMDPKPPGKISTKGSRQNRIITVRITFMILTFRRLLKGGFQSLWHGASAQHFWAIQSKVYRTCFIRLNRCYTITIQIITSTAHVPRQSSTTVAVGQTSRGQHGWNLQPPGDPGTFARHAQRFRLLFVRCQEHDWNLESHHDSHRHHILADDCQRRAGS